MNFSITSFYRFLPLSDAQVAELEKSLESWALELSLKGLVLIGHEGVNLTVSAPQIVDQPNETLPLEVFKDRLVAFLGLSDAHRYFKDSQASRHPYQVFKVKIKDEIVTLGKPGLAPASPVNSHLSPQEWHEALKDPEVVVLDTRNDYEVEIGKFRGALDLKLNEFREFPEKLKSAGLPKDKKVLMYCTGGIRCEKAILEMTEQGYTNVHQLDGGILNYLKEFPQQEFEGDCFVFDYRVAVNQQLEPAGKYRLCPHCGQPADQPIDCTQCSQKAVICKHCSIEALNTCSKNCAHHAEIGSNSRKPHQQELQKRHSL